MLAYAGIPFEDVRVSNADWGALKPTMPFGTMPVLDVDGRKLAQSVAVHRYVATLAGLMPSDPWGVAKADEVLGFMHVSAPLRAWRALHQPSTAPAAVLALPGCGPRAVQRRRRPSGAACACQSGSASAAGEGGPHLTGSVRT